MDSQMSAKERRSPKLLAGITDAVKFYTALK